METTLHPAIDSWEVASDTTDAVYIVRREATGEFTCTCPGFMYRKYCKHIRLFMVKANDAE